VSLCCLFEGQHEDTKDTKEALVAAMPPMNIDARRLVPGQGAAGKTACATFLRGTTRNSSLNNSSLGKPPALPEDSQSLTIPEVAQFFHADLMIDAFMEQISVGAPPVGTL